MRMSCCSDRSAPEPLGDFFAMLGQIVTEPYRIALGGRAHIRFEFSERNPLPVTGFRSVRFGRPVVAAAEYMHHFVFNQPVGHMRAILCDEQRRDRAVDAHFLSKPPPRRDSLILSRQRVTAACV